MNPYIVDDLLLGVIFVVDGILKVIVFYLMWLQKQKKRFVLFIII